MFRRIGAFFRGASAERRRKGPTRVLVTRHGQTVTNVEGRFCGHAETDLTEFGAAQARALGARLANMEIAAVYTSDYSRAMETARLALEGRGVPAFVEPGLRELHYGEWELQKGWHVARKWPEQHRLMRDEDPAWHPPGGENVAAVRERTFAALKEIIRKHPNQTVLVVSHGTAIQCMLGEVLGTPVASNFRFMTGNCALSEVRVAGGRMVVTRLNDTSHLEGLAPTARRR